MTVRVAIVDDDPLVRSGLRLMLGGADDLQVIDEGDDGDALRDLVVRSTPDVVLLDVRMARVDGVAALRALRATGDRTAVIVLTTFHSDELVLDALRAGAEGFLLKHTPPQEIVRAVRAVAAGEPILSPGVLEQVIAHVTREATPAPDLSALTDREREVAFAVADGLANPEIAAALYLSLGSVKAHISSALLKLGLDNRIQLAIAAHDARRSSG